jgi:uncharacterized phage protein (TIGR02218 family)
MLPITLDAIAHYALPYTPNWNAEMNVTFRVEADQVEGLTKREERRPLGATLRVVDFSLDYVLGAQPAAEFRAALRVLQDTAVRIPFWPVAAGHTGFSSRWGMDYTPVAAVGDVAATFALDGDVPTLRGFFDAAPTFKLHTPGLVGTRIRFKESSPATEALVPVVQVWADGPEIAGRTIHLFPFHPDWSSEVDAGDVDVTVNRKQLGFGRENSSAAFPQTGRRRPVFNFRTQGAETAKLLRFFLDRQGPVEAFWLPGWLAECQLAENTVAGSADIVLTDASCIADHDYLAFYTTTGEIITRAIVARDGNTLTLDSSPGNLAAANTTLCSLLLCRHAGGELTVRFSGPTATAKIQFVEVPQEYVTAEDETIGTTQGALPTTATLIVFTATLPDNSTQTWRYTNFERDLTHGEDSYSAKPFEVGNVTETNSLERQTTTLKSRTFAGNPLALFVPHTLEWPLSVELHEADVAAGVASNLRRYFAGEIEDVDADMPYLTANAKSLPALFDRKFPRQIYQPGCNWSLFETACGLLAADWHWTATVAAVNANRDVITLAGLASTNPAAAVVHFFAAGYVRFGVEPTAQHRMISDSTAAVGGAMAISLSTPLTTAPAVGSALDIYPGCDGRKETCIGRFDNYVRFGGCPFMPTGNPSVLKTKSGSGGGKK